MELLSAVLALISIHAVFVAAEIAFVKAAHSEIMANENKIRSTLTAAICRQLEDYLTVCTLANIIILLTMGVLMGLLLNNLTHSSLVDLAAVSWTQWAQFALGFGSILLIQVVVGFEAPRVLSISRTTDCTEASGWHLMISRVFLWPLSRLVNQLKRCTVRLAQGNSQGRYVQDRQLVPGDDALIKSHLPRRIHCVGMKLKG